MIVTSSKACAAASHSGPGQLATEHPLQQVTRRLPCTGSHGSSHAQKPTHMQQRKCQPRGRWVHLSPGASCAARLQRDAAGSRRGAALGVVQAVQGLPAAAQACQAQPGPPNRLSHTPLKTGEWRCLRLPKHTQSLRLPKHTQSLTNIQLWGMSVSALRQPSLYLSRTHDLYTTLANNGVARTRSDLTSSQGSSSASAGARQRRPGTFMHCPATI